MKLSKSAEKLDKYLHRMKAGKAEKITVEHVHRIIRKLQNKADHLRGELEAEQRDAKRERLRHKLKIVSAQMERANWLLGEIADGQSGNNRTQ